MRAQMLVSGIPTTLALAIAIGVKQRTVEKWLEACEAHITAPNLIKLAALLRVRVEWLASGEEPRL